MATVSTYTYTDDTMQDTATQVLGLVVDRLIKDNLLDEDVGQKFIDTHVVLIAKKSNGFKRWIEHFYKKEKDDGAYWVIVEVPTPPDQ